MAFDISWNAIGKLLLVGFGTYVFLPAALVLRDLVLRKVIGLLILNEKLEKDITQYAWKEMQWDQKYSQSYGSGYKEGKEIYLIDDVEVGMDEYLEFSSKQHEIRHSMRTLYANINNKSALLNWLNKHYKQDEDNPIPEWLEDERKRFSRKVE